MATGRIKSWDKDAGRGVIDVDGGDELPLQHTDIADEQMDIPQPGDEVEFEIAQTPEGRRATKACKLW